MRLMSMLLCGVAILLVSLAYASDGLIPYHILERSETGTIKVALDVEVPLVSGRLPTEEELGALSRHLVSLERDHDRSFVLFYLPGMKVGSGAYATAHHNPELEVKVLDFMLAQYPEYQSLLTD